jgi:hypothetical protein
VRLVQQGATSRKDTRKAIIDRLSAMGKERNAFLGASVMVMDKKGPAGDGSGRALHCKTTATSQLFLGGQFG